MLKARLDLTTILGARLDAINKLNARADFITALKCEFGENYMHGAVYFPLNGELVSNDGKYTITFTRNSIAYDSKGNRVEANIPRWEEV